MSHQHPHQERCETYCSHGIARPLSRAARRCEIAEDGTYRCHLIRDVMDNHSDLLVIFSATYGQYGRNSRHRSRPQG